MMTDKINQFKAGVLSAVTSECIGCFAYSAAGRDRFRCFVIISADIEKGFVNIADGKLHKLVKPKKKSFRHLKIDKHKNAELTSLIIKERITDKKLRGFISEYEGRSGAAGTPGESAAENT